MKTQRLYLAHPFDRRHEIRLKELIFEKETGIELVNPFYDVNRDDMELIDKGLMPPRRADKERGKSIVTGDLKLINSCDGILANYNKNDFSIGTPMEIFYNHYVLKHPGYLITDSKDVSGHPWITKNINKSFENYDKFADYIKQKHL